MRKRRLFVIVGALLVVIVATMIYVLASFDSIVKEAIENYGSQVTKTKVHVSDVNISLSTGEGSISGLTLGNPTGFSSQDIFRLGMISVKIDTDTVTENPIVIDKVVIQSPSVFYEINKAGASNVEVLRKNIARSSGSPAHSTSPAKKSSNEELKMIIRKLVIEGGKARVKIAALGGMEQSVNIPRLQLTNIGKKSNGATAAEIAQQVSKTLVNSVTGAVSKLGVGKYIGKSADLFKSAAGKAGNVISGAAGKMGGSLGGAAEKASGALKGLIGN